VVIAFFVVYESVLATLAGTHISPPGSLTCALREKWQGLFQRREDACIERIQDAFNCCGFMSTLDMPFPRQDATHGNDACMVRYERDQACFEPWREEERKVAVMLLVVPMAVFLWKVRSATHPGQTYLRFHARDVEEMANSTRRSQSCSRPPRNRPGCRVTSDCRATAVGTGVGVRESRSLPLDTAMWKTRRRRAACRAR
jgi:hypothetical protein